MNASPSEEYVEALLVQAQHDASRVTEPSLTHDAYILISAVHADYVSDIGEDLLAGQVAAGAVYLALRERVLDLADEVEHVLPTLRIRDLRRRLDMFRAWELMRANATNFSEEAALAELRGGLDAVGALLRTTDPAEEVAASRQLVHYVWQNLRPIYGAHLGLAWLGRCGPGLLIGRSLNRAAAVQAVIAGYERKQVAKRGGIARNTLNSWIEQHDQELEDMGEDMGDDVGDAGEAGDAGDVEDAG